MDEETVVEVGGDTFQSEEDVETNHQVDEARDEATQDEMNERHDAENADHYNDAKAGLI